MNGLLRVEVVQAQRPQALGTISLATPLSLVWWTLLAIALTPAVLLILIFGHYTRRISVPGQLQPIAGLLTLPSRTTGIVSRMLVHEGERINAGQPLVDVSADLVSARMGNTHAVVSAQLRAQEAEIGTTLANLEPEASAQAAGLRTRIGMLQAQVHQIDGQLALQRQQMIMMQRLVKAAAPLHARGIVDNIDFDQYQSSAMAQESRLKTAPAVGHGTGAQRAAVPAGGAAA